MGLAAGVGTAAVGLTLGAAEAQAATFDAEYDIVVVGGGGGGLPAALFSRWHGNKVMVLEKKPLRSAVPHSRRPTGIGCRTTRP
ncbi:FAD-binding protein [Undibacterium arcticum]